jgi:hypothetical protein
MAIPTMRGPKRRKNIGNEIAEMMKGFAQGYKAFGGGDDRQSRADARNPYSDQNLAKYDSRINSTPLGRMFRGEDNITGVDRGALVLQAKIRAAEERGDVGAIKKAQQDLNELYKMQEEGKILPKGGITVGSDKRVEALPTEAPLPPERPNELAAAIDDGVGDGMGDGNSQVAMVDPLYNDDGYYTPDYQIFAARGGPIPEMPNRLTGGALPLDDESEGETYEPEVVADSNGGLPTDPEELAPYAAEAADAGYRKLSKDLTSNSALSEEDPDYQARVADYGAKTQRMTDDEVAELDRMVDPDGTMPTATRGAARMAAAYKFFKDRGEEDRADDIAARLIQYNEFAGNTRSALGMQAIEQGNVKEGVKLLTDAYEQNIPDGKSVEATVNPDGSVNIAVGYKRQGADGKISMAPELERTIPLSELPKVAFQFTEEGKRAMMNFAATANKGRASAGAVGGGDAFEGALNNVRSASKAYAQTPNDETKAALDAAVEKANNTRAGGRSPDSISALTQKRILIERASGQTTTGTTSGRPSTGRTSAGSENERRERTADAALADVDKRQAQANMEDPKVRGEFMLERAAIAAKRLPMPTISNEQRDKAYDALRDNVTEELADIYNLPAKKGEKANPVADRPTLDAKQLKSLNNVTFDIMQRNGLPSQQAASLALQLAAPDALLRQDAKGNFQLGSLKFAMTPEAMTEVSNLRKHTASERGRLAAAKTSEAAKVESRKGGIQDQVGQTARDAATWSARAIKRVGTGVGDAVGGAVDVVQQAGERYLPSPSDRTTAIPVPPNGPQRWTEEVIDPRAETGASQIRREMRNRSAIGSPGRYPPAGIVPGR